MHVQVWSLAADIDNSAGVAVNRNDEWFWVGHHRSLLGKGRRPDSRP